MLKQTPSKALSHTRARVVAFNTLRASCYAGEKHHTVSAACLDARLQPR